MSKTVKCLLSFDLAFYGDSTTLFTKPKLQITKEEPEHKIFNKNLRFILGRWKAKKVGLIIILNGLSKYKGKKIKFTVFEKINIL